LENLSAALSPDEYALFDPSNAILLAAGFMIARHSLWPLI